MKIRWTKRAIRSLTSIHAYISRDSPAAAAQVAAAVVDATDQLEQFPQSGRPGRIEAGQLHERLLLPRMLLFAVRAGR
jgi:toxin ParE1/3/4